MIKSYVTACISCWKRPLGLDMRQEGIIEKYITIRISVGEFILEVLVVV